MAAKRKRSFEVQRRFAFTKTWRTVASFSKLAPANAVFDSITTIQGFLFSYRIVRKDLPAGQLNA